MMRHDSLLAAITAFFSLTFLTSTEASATVLYRLERTSTFQQGCFPPCECPLLETATLQGSFEFALITVGDVFDFYEVKDVRWIAEGPAGDHGIRGSGYYKMSTITGENQMWLDLAVDQNAPELYSNGEVPMAALFPEIDVTISKNGGVCFDTVMGVRARPTPRLAVEPSSVSWDSGLEIVGYDVVKGSLSVLRATDGAFDLATDACLADDVQDNRIQFDVNPDAGDGFFMLARVGESTYDTGLPGQVRSRDPGIASSPASCP